MTDAMEFHTVSASIARHEDTAQNDHMVTGLHQVIHHQRLAHDTDQTPVVAEMVGQSDIPITLSVYGHLCDR